MPEHPCKEAPRPGPPLVLPFQGFGERWGEWRVSLAPSPELWPRGDQKPGCPHGHGLMGSEAPAAFEGSDAVTGLVGRQAHSRLEKDRNSPCALPSVTVGTGKTLLLVTAEGRRMALRGLNSPCTQQPQAPGVGVGGGGVAQGCPLLILCSALLLLFLVPEALEMFVL